MESFRLNATNKIILSIPDNEFEKAVFFFSEILLLKEQNDGNKSNSKSNNQITLTIGEINLQLNKVKSSSKPSIQLVMESTDLKACYNYLHANDIDCYFQENQSHEKVLISNYIPALQLKIMNKQEVSRIKYVQDQQI
ncbi:hypothetical protein ACP6L2_03230 [Sphingobacterium lactis]|uniref:hypothetical protein n=1 Tax=Sphingobacterium lactis TaxID=797291 RepID=UPI003F7E7498